MLHLMLRFVLCLEPAGIVRAPPLFGHLSKNVISQFTVGSPTMSTVLFCVVLVDLV